MTIARKFIEKLQAATAVEPFTKKFWENYDAHSGAPTFEKVLENYASYCKDFPELKDKMSEIFWQQVEEVGGTPIIEDRLGSAGECDVYFLFPKNQISNSSEKKGEKQVLYLQGDFHGYNAIRDKQRLSEIANTGIMWHRDVMPKNAIVVYQYIQAEPGITIEPQPERRLFFTDEGFTVPEKKSSEISHIESPKISSSPLPDKYSQHNTPFRFPSLDKVFRVNPNVNHARIPGEQINWRSLLATETPSNTRSHFIHHSTLYSTKDNKLVKGNQTHSKIPVTENYHMDLYKGKPPYDNFTRHIHVFKPKKGEIENLVVVNDGRPYLIAGIMEHFEKMVTEGKLSPNTALVFINTLPGLEEETLPQEAKDKYKEDPSAKNAGMGERLIDYKYGIKQYIDFLDDELFARLKEEKISVPEDPRRRIMMGSSLSGTASIYIGLTRPDLFGTVIAQSPSYENRSILSDIPRKMLAESDKRDMYLSCGNFEHPNFAAANNFVEYTKDVADKLGKPLLTDNYGHQFVSWNEALEQSLPAVLKPSHALDAKEQKKSTTAFDKLIENLKAKHGDKFEKFKAIIGREGLNYLMTEVPLSSSENTFIKEHQEHDPITALAIRRNQNITAILLSDKGLEALEQKYISLNEAMNMSHPHHLLALFSEHGFTALKEGLITPKDALRFGENSSQYLEELCTENGLNALRTAKSQNNLDGFMSGIIQHANQSNNAGALEHSLKTGIPLDKVQSDIENSVQRPRLG